MKTAARLLSLFALSLLLAGCWQKSLHPFYTAKDLNSDPNLVGKWLDEEDDGAEKMTWTFSSNGEKRYFLVQAETDETIEYDAHLFRLGNVQFLDIHSRERKLSDIPAHHLFKISLTKDQLELRPLNPGWIGEHRQDFDHIEIKDPSDPDKGEFILTGNTEALQKLIRRHQNSKDFFADPGTLKRAPQGKQKAE